MYRGDDAVRHRQVHRTISTGGGWSKIVAFGMVGPDFCRPDSGSAGGRPHAGNNPLFAKSDHLRLSIARKLRPHNRTATQRDA